MGVTEPIDSLSKYSDIRPVFSGLREHDDSVATILLYTSSKSDVNYEMVTSATGAVSTQMDYLSNLTETIFPLIKGSIASDVQGFPQSPKGSVAKFKLDKINDYYGVFNNFSVSNMVETHDQISKIHMNFGAKWNVFLFGNTPNIYRISGSFLDTQEYPYYQEFITAYEEYLSGRKCVERGMQLKMLISGQIIDGFLLNVSVTHNAFTPAVKEFQLTLLVKGVSWIRNNYIQKPDGSFEQQFNGLSNFNRFYSEKLALIKPPIGLAQEVNTDDSSDNGQNETYTSIDAKKTEILNLDRHLTDEERAILNTLVDIKGL